MSLSIAGPQYEDRVLFETGLVRIGLFRCDREHPVFQNTGPADNFCFVFPRTAVAIAHEHEHPFLANPTIATFYNLGQVYERSAISPTGDYCDWFAIKPQAIADVRERLNLKGGKSHELFTRTHAAVGDAAYLRQRQVFEHVASGASIDALYVEESVLLLLEQLLHGAIVEDHATPVSVHQQTVVRDVETLLSQRYDDSLSIGEIAAHVGISEYHLARLFRRVTGRTLHGYRHALRTRDALRAIAQNESSLTSIALGLGYSSQSHFTETFRRTFGLLPSEFRRASATGPIALQDFHLAPSVRAGF
jgi:AraC-like DNA-binding protein